MKKRQTILMVFLIIAITFLWADAGPPGKAPEQPTPANVRSFSDNAVSQVEVYGLIINRENPLPGQNVICDAEILINVSNSIVKKSFLGRDQLSTNIYRQNESGNVVSRHPEFG